MRRVVFLGVALSFLLGGAVDLWAQAFQDPRENFSSNTETQEQEWGQDQTPDQNPDQSPELHQNRTQGSENFSLWLEDFQREALQAGISPRTLAMAFENITPDDRVVTLDRKQPEGRLSFARYIKNANLALRLRKGHALKHQHADALENVARRYGVPASVIVALWGIESGYGQNMGSFSVIESLATLAYEGRRASFFRQELIEALRILEEEGMDRDDFTGSWAGAMGQCQFMPSTYRRFAVDADGDGRRDIWKAQADVFASIARYLAAEGWKAGQSWGREVRFSKPLSPDLMGLEVVKTVQAWRDLGVVGLDKKALPASAIRASLVQPDGKGGRAFLVYDNFRAVMRWNRSTYFALTVGLMSDSLRGAPSKTK